MRKFSILLLLFIFSFTMLGCNNEKKDQVVAIVNGTEITAKQLNKHFTMIKIGYETQTGSKVDEKANPELFKEMQESAYEDIIMQTLIKQAAAEKNIVISDKEVEEDLQTLKKSNGEENFAKLLKQMSMTEADLKEQIELESLFMGLKDKVTADVTVTDEEVEEYYNDNTDLYATAGGMEISHILLETEEEALDILARLDKGENFAELAREHSTCPSKEQGGDLGLIDEYTNFVEEFKVAALALKAGEMTKEPVKSEFGYHIIKTGEYKEPEISSFEDIETNIAGELKYKKQNDLFNNYLTELRGKATIEDKRENK